MTNSKILMHLSKYLVLDVLLLIISMFLRLKSHELYEKFLQYDKKNRLDFFHRNNFHGDLVTPMFIYIKLGPVHTTCQRNNEYESILKSGYELIKEVENKNEIIDPVPTWLKSKQDKSTNDIIQIEKNNSYRNKKYTKSFKNNNSYGNQKYKKRYR
jgi:hypothetical protein